MLEIIKWPNTILEEQMPVFDFEQPILDPAILEKEMIECMIANNGIGLSANQVGIKAKVFVMGTKEESVAIFNPIILEASDLVDDTEGCLSFPFYFVKIKRPNKIKAKWQTSNGEWKVGEFTGMSAKCFLHEYDHLEGIIFKDRVSNLKWELASKKALKYKRNLANVGTR